MFFQYDKENNPLEILKGYAMVDLPWCNPLNDSRNKRFPLDQNGAVKLTCGTDNNLFVHECH